MSIGYGDKPSFERDRVAGRIRGRGSVACQRGRVGSVQPGSGVAWRTQEC